MSTAVRKARKRAGEKFFGTPRVGTPIEERWSFKWVRHPGDIATGIKAGVRPRSAASQLRIVNTYAGDN